jgi:NAD(P)-dependent dehydrogenase (short-subunit alcohol dehydrogenase family)
MWVLVHGRNRGRGTETVNAIERAGGRASFFEADLSTLEGVRALASHVAQAHDRLDILINNAGIGTGGSHSVREVTPDGFELRFAVNYLAGFLLTRLLLPLLLKTGDARIVNVASAGQQAIDFNDVMLEKGFSGVRAYCQSKLAQILFTIDLAEELKGTGVIVNSLHPATYMDTTMVKRAGVTPMSTVEEGAQAILQLARSPELKGRSGLYFNGLKEARAEASAYDPKVRAQLRHLSFELCKLADPR